jgi:hypothetical protein
MENANEPKKQESEFFPGFVSDLECMKRALFTGLAAFTPRYDILLNMINIFLVLIKLICQLPGII